MIALHLPPLGWPDAPERRAVALLAPVAGGPLTLDVVHHCDALTLLCSLPSESVNCVVTSPPYFGLRDYGVAGQIGLEPTPAAFEGLTPRQKDVLRLLAKGKSNKEIARELDLAEGTVKIHLAAVLRFLKARNRTEAAVLAARFKI